MSSIDKNKIFFDLIHYILSEQKNVDWILKTSLINFVGINSVINNTKYQQTELINDVIDYIYDIKPYHTEFEQFIEKYSSQRDEGLISGAKANEHMDIEIDIRYDNVTSIPTDQNELSDIEYMDTTSANRLYFYKTKDLTEIKDYLNCNFKGLTIDGSNFDIDRMGYEAFLYDEKLYDAPTITSEYSFFDYSEELTIPYTKQPVKIGIKTLLLDGIYNKNQIEVASYYENRTPEKTITINEYVLEENILTLFSPIRNDEKIYITITQPDLSQHTLIFVGNSFIDMDENTVYRKLVPLGTVEFDIPDNTVLARKLTVHRETKNGSRYPYLNYIKNQKTIEINPNDFQHGDSLMMNVVDYQYVYDKIYNYEDPYGQSNNTIILDGDEFLRPYYEQERPSELSVVHPLTNVMLFYEDDDINKVDIFNYKKEKSSSTLISSDVIQLTQDFIIGDLKIFVNNISSLTKPIIKNNINKPGLLMVGSEIIEYFEINESEKSLSKLRRGTRGSYIGNHQMDTQCIIIRDETSEVIKNNITSASYIVNNNNEFLIPGTYKNKNKVSVYIRPLISLLKPITLTSKTINISSDNIEKPIYKEIDGVKTVWKKGKMYINDDVIYFDNIEYNTTSNSYTITGFDITKTYDVNSQIYSINPEYTKDYKIDTKTKTISFNNQLANNEIILIVNN